MSEQRQHTRYPVEVGAEVHVDGHMRAASTKDLSSGGAALILDRPLEENSRIALTLFLTQDGIEDPDEEPFEAEAVVVWSAERDDEHHIAGVRFDGVAAAQQQQLGRFLAAVAE
jgi:c-di-GMP-binding flagellar brake protein YcgR